MFKKIVLVSILIVFGITFSACSARTSSPSVDIINLQKVDFSKVVKMKKGTSCFSQFLIFPIGTDNSVMTAAANAGISKVHYLEKSSSNLLGGYLYSEYCTDVYGE